MLTTPCASEVDELILGCLDGTEWHLSLWYPRVTRMVLGLPAGPADAELQDRLATLIENGTLEVGVVEGAAFAARPFTRTAPAGDLYVRLRPDA